MNILISNDDGIHATGIEFLKNVLEKKHKVTVIAPDKERSSCGHGITLGEPVRVKQIDENSFACSGYPADCILIGVGHIMKDNRPDLIISGINHGANLGQDRYYSGTIAAAREAAFRGIPSIAVSLVTQNLKDVEHFDVAADYVSRLLDQGCHELIPEKGLLNINVPNRPMAEISGVKYTVPGYQKYSEEVIERQDGRGKTYYWVGGTYRGWEEIPGTDCDAVFNNYVSVNMQCLQGKEIQDQTTLDSLRTKIEKL
jgi:5'-nucleotidase